MDLFFWFAPEPPWKSGRTGSAALGEVCKPESVFRLFIHLAFSLAAGLVAESHEKS